MQSAWQLSAALHALYPEQRSKPLSKSRAMMRSIRMSYCSDHKGEPLRTDGSPWIIASTLTFPWRDQAQAYFHQGVGSMFQEYIFCAFWRTQIRICGEKPPLAEKPFLTWQIDRKGMKPSKEMSDRPLAVVVMLSLRALLLTPEGKVNTQMNTICLITVTEEEVIKLIQFN